MEQMEPREKTCSQTERLLERRFKKKPDGDLGRTALALTDLLVTHVDS